MKEVYIGCVCWTLDKLPYEEFLLQIIVVVLILFNWIDPFEM